MKFDQLMVRKTVSHPKKREESMVKSTVSMIVNGKHEGTLDHQPYRVVPRRLAVNLIS